MSKVVRRKFDETIKLLEDGAKQLTFADSDRRILLLSNMQEAAVAMGVYAEQLKGENLETVEVLEQFCEGLYQVSMAEDEVQLIESSNELLALFESLHSALDKEFPDKQEVVFLPYKASMWDSLESVWRQYASDDSYETYVVPIPYYNRDSKMNMVEFVYEGKDYPEDVPVVDYQTFDLKLHHPDMVYIHNPYDEYNYVTSIDPEFYSSRIHKFTEKLIYIPYFVLEEIDPDNEAAVEGMSHFCYTPGTIYANEVILQSEAMRTIYIREYAKAAITHGQSIDTDELARRFQGSGSPKHEKIRQERENRLRLIEEVPEEWKKYLYKPDGTLKKIIIYNNSVTAMIEGRELTVDKINRALKTFYEYREDVALLWRPHPLIRQTIESMCPSVWDSYAAVVNAYKNGDWGIYDDTPNMDRALAIADGYYGDTSSLVSLCKAIHLPVMIQNIAV